MLDLREGEIPAYTLRDALHLRGLRFTWKRWINWYDDPQDHNHCQFCNSCICDARDRDPFDKPGHVENGHFRYAYHAQLDNGASVWACRNCFKALAPLAGWTRTGSRATAS